MSQQSGTEGPYVSGTNCCGSVSHDTGPTPPGFAGPLVTLFAEEQSMQEQVGGLSDNCVESLRPPCSLLAPPAICTAGRRPLT